MSSSQLCFLSIHKIAVETAHPVLPSIGKGTHLPLIENDPKNVQLTSRTLCSSPKDAGPGPALALWTRERARGREARAGRVSPPTHPPAPRNTAEKEISSYIVGWASRCWTAGLAPAWVHLQFGCVAPQPVTACVPRGVAGQARTWTRSGWPWLLSVAPFSREGAQGARGPS